MRDHSDTGFTTVVYQLIREMAPEPVTELGPRMRLVSELGYDSLGLLELVTAVEDTLGLPPLREADVAGIESVEDLMRVVTVARARSAGAGR